MSFCASYLGESTPLSPCSASEYGTSPQTSVMWLNTRLRITTAGPHKRGWSFALPTSITAWKFFNSWEYALMKSPSVSAGPRRRYASSSGYWTSARCCTVNSGPRRSMAPPPSQRVTARRAALVNTGPGGAEMGLLGSRLMVVSRSEEHTSELQSQSNLVCRLLLE